MTRVNGKLGDIMKNHVLTQAIKHWQYIAPVIRQPKNEKEFKELTSRLDNLLDYIGENENHPLAELADMISHVIESYEQKKQYQGHTMGVDALKYLMQTHNVKQADLQDIASQGVMSEILNGKRELNLRQIKLLAKYFHVSPETFIDDE